MKPTVLALATWLPVASLCLLAGSDTPAQAVIKGIRAQGTNVVVVAGVPAGTQRATLETRSKATRGAWTPKSVVMTEGAGSEITFTIPASGAMEVMRVVTEDAASLPLPDGFYNGVRTFAPLVTRYSQPANPSIDTTGQSLTFNSAVAGDSSPIAVRSVEESDIWKFSGSNLYFFNQQRGLQIIDVATPAAPALRSTLPLASYGEQMYVLPAHAQGSEWLALLAQEQCRWDSTEVIVVQADPAAPAGRKTLQVPGRVVESRMIGDILVIASQGWSNHTVLVTNDTSRGDIVIGGPALENPGGPVVFRGDVFEQTIAEAYTRVTAVDLADPANAAIRSSVSLPASATAIHATDRLLFVATASSSWQIFGTAEIASPTNAVHVIDVSDPAGNISLAGSFETAGRVTDKFKFGLDGDALSIVSQIDARWTSNRFQPQTVMLETFSVAAPAAPARLASLPLVVNESVYATRFAPGRAYVVTFRQIDPLWIIDLSNPATPRIRGELQVPGWSTYIEPLGDRLLAMGVESGRAAVSLFDVADPDHPGLVDKVYLGDGWSWSEANSDEKAFRVFPDRNLALLPWHGRIGTNRWFQGIQLLDFTRDDLTLRGAINHEATPRRASVVGDSVLSISGRELVSAGIADRDHPAVSATLDLVSPADRVVVAGTNLVRVVVPRWSADLNDAAPLRLGLSTVTNPDRMIATLSLTNLPLLGSAYRDGRLYLLQRASDTYRWENRLETNSVVIWTYQPPIVRYSTNEVIAPHPVPPVRQCTNIVRRVEFPPAPGSPGYVTNIVVTRCVEIPQPPTLQTNWVVSSYMDWQPPLPVTNAVVRTNLVAVPVPGGSSLTVVGVSGDSLTSIGVTTFTNGSAYSSNVEAHWAGDGVLAWTRVGGWVWPRLLVADYVSPVFASPMGIFPRWLGGGYGGEVLVFDVSNPSAPALASSVEFDNDGGSLGNVISAGNKLFASTSRSEWVSADTNAPPGGPWFDGSRLLTTYSLRVIDLTDPAEPAVRDAINLPGQFLGVSHGGNLLYTRTELSDTNGFLGTALQALAYDGVGASLVTSRAFVSNSVQQVVVKADGRLLVPLAEGAGGPRLETVALSREGILETYSATPVQGAINGFSEFGDFVVGDAGDVFIGIDVSGETPAILGTAPYPCSIGLDPAASDASPSAGLWIPRGDFGLWRVSFGQP